MQNTAGEIETGLSAPQAATDVIDLEVFEALDREAAEATYSRLRTVAASESAVRTFWRLCDVWKLTIADQLTLLGVNRATLYRWKQGKFAPLDRPVMQRLSCLFGIYGALQQLLPIPQRAHEWIRKPNAAPFLAGGSALDRMLGGEIEDLFAVREYLSGELRR